MLAQDPLFNGWSAETQAVYMAFSERLMREAPLVITIGKGGLSYYKEMGNESVFVCHFNAKPQRLRNDLGFADFRLETLRNRVDLPLALDAIQKTTEPEIRFKLNKQWCSLHFSLSDYARVADIFYEHIIVKVQ